MKTFAASQFVPSLLPLTNVMQCSSKNFTLYGKCKVIVEFLRPLLMSYKYLKKKKKDEQVVNGNVLLNFTQLLLSKNK